MNLISSLTLLVSSLITLNATIVNAPINSLSIPVSPYNAPQQEIVSKVDTWLKSLRMCESGGNDKALNPKDLDGTESIGRYQFKTPTFYHFAKIYNIKVTDVWNGDEQEQIVRKMIEDKEVNLRKQFPDCINHHIGLPPTGDT